jgi:hypothetical protein
MSFVNILGGEKLYDFVVYQPIISLPDGHEMA